MWTYHGQKRPSFAEEPAVGQESVWDYPRPPRLMPDARRIVVQLGELIIAESMQAYRVLETASPPAFYIPPDDVRLQLLQPHPGEFYGGWVTHEIAGPFKGLPATEMW